MKSRFDTGFRFNRVLMNLAESTFWTVAEKYWGSITQPRQNATGEKRKSKGVMRQRVKQRERERK